MLAFVIVALWQAYVSLGHVSATFVSSPSEVAATLAADLRTGKLAIITLATLQNLVIGMILGAIAGFALASFAVLSKAGHDVLVVLTAIFNPLPSIAILPLAMIWFGLTAKSIVFVVALASVWPLAISTDNGFRTISPTTHLVARNLGLRGWRLVIDVLLPAALPSIMSGLKASWAFGWRTVVAAELVFGVAGATGGLGWYINNARYYQQTSEIFAGLVVISALGILVEALFGAVERRTVITWGMKTA